MQQHHPSEVKYSTAGMVYRCTKTDRENGENKGCEREGEDGEMGMESLYSQHSLLTLSSIMATVL